MNDTPAPGPLALIIEDDERLATIFTEAVRQAGFTTRTIRRGDEAMQLLGSLEPSLVILDLHLPQVSGETILQALRQDKRLGSTRVVLATADAELAKIIEDDCDFVLVKPISFTQLRDLASRLL
jgi:CheY-like chemotaxis protein